MTIVGGGASFEVTTLRRDVETFGRHATVAFTEDWEEDARRRDFTLNALYAGRDGTVFDPLGGYEDVVAGRVRFIGDAEARIKEDYLRILRFFRFNAYYGKGSYDTEGLAASVRLRDGLGRLSAERIKAELWRLLLAPGATTAIEALFDYGLLPGVLGGAPRLDRFNRLVEIERAQGLAPDAARRIAALAVFVQEAAPRLAARFRLSNAEQAVLALGAIGPDMLLCRMKTRRSVCSTGGARMTSAIRCRSPGQGQMPLPTMQTGARSSRFPNTGRRPSFPCGVRTS